MIPYTHTTSITTPISQMFWAACEGDTILVLSSTVSVMGTGHHVSPPITSLPIDELDSPSSWTKGNLCSNSRAEFTRLLFLVEAKGNADTTGPFSGRLGELRVVAAFPKAIR